VRCSVTCPENGVRRTNTERSNRESFKNRIQGTRAALH
jgi:hypothetical protein